MLRDVPYVPHKLEWMRAERIWPNGLRYLWTDAFGVMLYVSLCRALGEERLLEQAEQLVADVERVLGRRRGLRIGEAPDRDGQYFHYLAMWLFALARLGELKPEYRARGVALARDIHPAFVIPGRGVIWKMKEDLSGPYPGYGLGAMDAFDGYVSYRTLDEEALSSEIAEMRTLIDRDWRTLDIEQDLGLGMMLWLSHFFPDEPWAKAQIRRASRTLDAMWSIHQAISAARPGCATPSLLLPITACPWACKPQESGPSASNVSTPSSRAGARATNMIGRRSPG